MVRYCTTSHRLRMYCGPYADRVSQVTGMGKEDIAQLIYDCGIEWIEANGLHRLASCRAWWRDFMHYWYSNDFAFITEYHTASPETYKQFHLNTLKAYKVDAPLWYRVKRILKAD